MKMTRREVLAAGAGAGAALGFGLAPAGAADAEPITRAIPASGERLPVIGIGTNRWIADAEPARQQAFREILRVFRRNGGRVIDTAPSYRSSEQALGNLIAELGFDDAFFLATKVDREQQAEGIARMQASLDKLNRERMDLMQVHNLRGFEAQIRTLVDWREAGRLRYIGITTHRTSQHAEMEALMRSAPLDFIQVNYSLTDRVSAERILPLAADRGIAVLINRPFANGRLFAAVRGQALPDWASEFDCQSWGQFFLKYVVSHPSVTCAIPGMTTVAHAEDNMGANYGRLPDARLRQRQVELIESI